MTIRLPLDAQHRDLFRDQGFLGPLTLMSPEEMATLRVELEEVLRAPGRAPAPDAEQSRGRLADLMAPRNGGSPVPYVESRHLDAPAVHRLCTHPALLSAARSLYGADLLLWRSTLISKAPGGPDFQWHQDWGGVFAPGDEYGLEPPLSFTFWIAISEVSEENGCLRFVPGTRAVLPAAPGAGRRATLLADGNAVDPSVPVPVPLRPGQCVVFTDRALHASGPNLSGAERIGLAVRLTVPAVRVRPHFPGHAVQLVSGRDTAGLNTLADAPVTTRVKTNLTEHVDQS
ncbi:phytanoyl-CoA dioxygenase family protein [Streptomyces xanthophaeus]|uniref:Non-ribosomal peptide synthase n=1 Tax=Streptomyces xanthophaeus TaxID=67385 RepID=A0A919LAP3_9ACTN|nr:phytanoyl-CoA dioxygenase family protein [Streptomyces xanthophaeus]GHI86598.1 non-ribosomal peptide synthase [Streptomyces xanthophaeus]